MAIVISKQFPMEPGVTTTAYARLEGRVSWNRKSDKTNLIFFTVYKSATARQADKVNGVEHLVTVPASSENTDIQDKLDERAILIDQLTALDYGLAKLIDPVLGAGEDLI